MVSTQQDTSAVKTSKELRQVILKEVEAIICRDRSGTHGEPEDNFAKTAAIWNVLLSKKLNTPLDPIDVAIMMVGFKLARAADNPGNRDNAIDSCGYAGCWAGLIDLSAQKAQIRSYVAGMQEALGLDTDKTRID
jgi:hypothetical protein